MKPAITLILLLLCIKPCFCKNASGTFAEVDKVALQIPETSTHSTDGIAKYILNNFDREEEKVRAIFIWIASNIAYDVKSMNSKITTETLEQRASKALKSRKGICENYAFLFHDICGKVGIKSYIVDGYTKQYGAVDRLSHAWCVAYVNGKWAAFDPTWGAGYVDKGKFHRRINESYFNVQPSAFIKSHMPFDYQWQLLNYPVTHQEFYDGNTQENKSKPYFSYTDSIDKYEAQSKIERLTSSLKRVEENGIKNSLISEKVKQLKREIEIASYNIKADKQNRNINLYNSAVNDYNDAIVYLNDFIRYKNRQFMPEKTDADIQLMLDNSAAKLNDAIAKLEQVREPDRDVSRLTKELKEAAEETLTTLNRDRQWLKEYLSKGKAERKAMLMAR